jgi:hypothetical protein
VWPTRVFSYPSVDEGKRIAELLNPLEMCDTLNPLSLFVEIAPVLHDIGAQPDIGRMQRGPS